jgi:hypothetical protein
VDFLQFDFLKVGGGGDYAAAAGSEVDGNEGVGWHGSVFWKSGSFFMPPFDAIPNIACSRRNAAEKESCPQRPDRLSNGHHRSMVMSQAHRLPHDFLETIPYDAHARSRRPHDFRCPQFMISQPAHRFTTLFVRICRGPVRAQTRASHPPIGGQSHR